MGQDPHNRDNRHRPPKGTGPPGVSAPPADPSKPMVPNNFEPIQDSDLRQRITDILKNGYGLDDILDLYEIKGGYNNRTLGITFGLGDPAGRYIVREYRHGITREEIRFEHALIHHAQKNGFQLVAGVVANKWGETFIRRAQDENLYALYEYLPGEDKYTWNRPDLTDTEFCHAGTVLADFHHAVSDFNPGGYERKEPSILKLGPTLSKQLNQLAEQKRKGKLIPYLRNNIERIQAIISRQPLNPQEREALPVIANHYDYHPGNLKWHNERVVGIFDFDWAKIDLRLFDVVMGMIYFCSCWDEQRDGTLRLDKGTLFLRNYQKRLITLKGLATISSAEQSLFPKMITWANIYLLHWGVAAYIEDETSNDAQYLTYLKHSIRLMYWMDTHQNELADCIARALA